MLSPQSPKPPSLPRWATALLGFAAVAAGLSLPWLLPVLNGPSPVRADVSVPGPASATTDAADPPDPSASLVRLYAATVAVLVLGLGVVYLYRRRLAAWAPPGGDKQLEVLGAARINLQSHVVLVRARGQKFLAGIDGSGLKLLVPVPLDATASDAGADSGAALHQAGR